VSFQVRICSFGLLLGLSQRPQTEVLAGQLSDRPQFAIQKSWHQAEGLRHTTGSVWAHNGILSNTKELNLSLHDVEAGVKRAIAAFQRRPEIAVHANPPAVSRWESATRVVTHSTTKSIATDMPKELGGSGDQVTGVAVPCRSCVLCSDLDYPCRGERRHPAHYP